MATATQDQPHSPSELPPVPGSPTCSYASTAQPITAYNLSLPSHPRPPHVVLSKQDLAQSQAAYTSLLSTAKTYRQALADLSTAASAFGSSLESCARLKESCAEPLRASTLPPGGGGGMAASLTSPAGAVTADTLLAAAGLHHLISNHQQILSETVYRAFEVPLLDELDKWRRHMEDEEDGYNRAVATRSKEISRLEKDGAKLQKARRRDVAKFREYLVNLTNKLDELTALHARHAATMLRESQDSSLKITDATCSLVRAEVEIFESLARKGWSGGGLEDVLEKGVDLFAAEDVVAPVGAGIGAAARTSGDPGSKLFSILPPNSILAEAGTSSSDPNSGTTMALPRPTQLHAKADSLLAEPTATGSQAHSYGFVSGSRDLSEMLVGSGDRTGYDGEESDSIFSEARARRQFSPQPIRRATTDATFDSLTMGLGEPPRQLSPTAEASVEEARDQGNESDSQGLEATEDQPLLERRPQGEQGSSSPSPTPQPETSLVHGADEEEHPWRDEGRESLKLDSGGQGQEDSPSDSGDGQSERGSGFSSLRDHM